MPISRASTPPPSGPGVSGAAKPSFERTPEEWQKVMGANLDGVVRWRLIDLAQQVGARATAPTPSLSEKVVGANTDIEATADTISALPNGDGFRLLFTDDRTTLSDTGERLLDTLAERMERQTELRLSVLAYAGGTPDTAANARVLSLERALAVRNYLFDRGIRGSRIDLRAMGNTATEGPPERVDLLLVN